MKVVQKIFILLIFTCTTSRAFGKDSLYVFNALNFQIQSSSGYISEQKSLLLKGSIVDGCMKYSYYEDKEGCEHYGALITVIDCREKLKNKSEAERNIFIQEFRRTSYYGHYPWPDTTILFRNLFSIQGGGKNIKKWGEKREKYKFVKFFYEDLIFELLVMDAKKELDESYNDFLNRFELTK